MNSTVQRGYVYVLTNASLPGMVKIGMTTRDPFRRAAELHTTGLPTSFEVAIAVLVDDPKKVEAQLHREFGYVRIKNNREFFQVDNVSVLLTLGEIIAQSSPANPTIEAPGPYEWELNLNWVTFLQRETSNRIDLRIERVRGEGYLKDLWDQSLVGDEKSQDEIIRLEESGSLFFHNLLLNSFLSRNIKTNLLELVDKMVSYTPDQIPSYIQSYPQNVRDFGKVYLKITDKLDEANLRRHRWSYLDNGLLFLVLLYSWDIILADDLDPQEFARNFGDHLELSQYAANKIADILKSPWKIKGFIGDDPLMRDRLYAMKGLLEILEVLPDEGWPQ
ncbi:GIY-YIG nuclease family protein [Deinococcus arenicola]|uniref:GIY-YIG nuclease family protein n=1 Tax=Deinococcus arenicola TaxID=2994950 RepID=A0ABU4DQ22_9DEIO|nr:GIY-YIG nuclease family protein [Deinococcus sp. ZS9-10]MDV6374529.1 GIY-YIG nuclease family protein [Deinococcus sp. ZS9-10]